MVYFLRVGSRVHLALAALVLRSALMHCVSIVSGTRLLERRRLGRPHHVLHVAKWIASRRMLQRQAALDAARDSRICSESAATPRHLQVHLPGFLVTERRWKWPRARKKTPPAFSVLQVRRPGREWPVVRGWAAVEGEHQRAPRRKLRTLFFWTQYVYVAWATHGVHRRPATAGR